MSYMGPDELGRYTAEQVTRWTGSIERTRKIIACTGFPNQNCEAELIELGCAALWFKLAALQELSKLILLFA